jgi:hypothetical protein
VSTHEFYSDATVSEVIGEVRAAFAKHRRGKVTIYAGKRSLDHNAISHIWYAQIATELREDTPEGVHCECKLRFGVPILRAEDEDFRAFYDKAIKNSLTYEQKVEAMRFVPVTRLMTTDQMKRYLDDMQRSYAGRVQLEYPKESA